MISRLSENFAAFKTIFKEDLKNPKLSSQIQNSQDSNQALQIPISKTKHATHTPNHRQTPPILSKQPVSKLAHDHFPNKNTLKNAKPPLPSKSRPKPIDFEILKLKGRNSHREEKFKVYTNESEVLKIDTNFRAQWSKTECISRSIDDDCVTEDEHITYSLNRTFRYFCKYLRHNKKIWKY